MITLIHCTDFQTRWSESSLFVSFIAIFAVFGVDSYFHISFEPFHVGGRSSGFKYQNPRGPCRPRTPWSAHFPVKSQPIKCRYIHADLRILASLAPQVRSIGGGEDPDTPGGFFPCSICTARAHDGYKRNLHRPSPGHESRPTRRIQRVHHSEAGGQSGRATAFPVDTARGRGGCPRTE